MTRMVEYQDNLFLVNERTKLLEKAIALDIDPQTFSSQFKTDMDHIGRTLFQIKTQLNLSGHTLQKPENLRNLMLASQRAMELAEKLTEKGYLLQEYGEEMAAALRDETDELEKMLLDYSDSPGTVEQVSPEEFEFLLKEDI